jgi:hypothetical protein
VQVRVGSERHRQSTPLGFGVQRPQIQRRIDSQRPSVAQIDQIRGVAQTVVDHRDDRLAQYVTHSYTIP